MSKDQTESFSTPEPSAEIESDSSIEPKVSSASRRAFLRRLSFGAAAIATGGSFHAPVAKVVKIKPGG